MAEFDFGIENLNDTITNDFLNSSEIGAITTKVDDITKIDDEEPEVKVETKDKPSDEEITNQVLGDEPEVAKKVETPKVETTEESVFESLSKELITQGIFTPDEDEDGNVIEASVAKTPEEFKDSFLHEIKKQSSLTLQNFLSKFGDDRQELFNAIFVNGVDPQDYIPKFNELQDFSNLDLTLESNQEKVIKAYYKKANWSDESIDKRITKLKDYGDLEDEVKEVHPKLVEDYKFEINKQQESKQLQLQQQERGLIEFQRNVDSVFREALKTKDFEGFPITEKTYKEAFDYIAVPKWKSKSGDLLTELDKAILETKNPNNIKQRVLLGLLAKNNFDLSKIKKSAITKETGELFSTLQKDKKTNTATVRTGSNWIDKL